MDEVTTVPTIIIKILDIIEISNVNTGTTLTLADLISQSGQTEGDQTRAIQSIAPNLSIAWAFVSVSAEEIAALVARVAAPGQGADLVDPEPGNPDYTAPKFDHFFEVVPGEGIDAAQLADALGAWADVIEYAYVMDIASDPAVVATGNPFFSGSQQGYFAPAPMGVDTNAAWAKGADGSGLSFIDIEQGWFLGHEDLPQTINLRQGVNRTTSFAHGTGVLGEVVGVDNSAGIVGAAPNANTQVVAYNDDLTSSLSVQRIADRILNAAAALPFGSVLLLEVQLQGTVGGTATLVPVETDPLVFDAIKLATKVGVIVVEAGGNGGADLDTFVMAKGPLQGKHTLSRTNAAEFADSGAIIVGAALSATPHDRAVFSNFGSRVDCFAWGENIVTTGWDSAKPTANDVYWGVNLLGAGGQPSFFGGTSGASPIVVGVCLLLQSLRGLLTPKTGSGKLGPFSMRRCLSNAANGTASAQATDGIGVMPDLAKIIANEFQ